MSYEPPPPLGVAPKWIRQQQRLEELCEAVVRYRQAAFKVPDEWLSEICELTSELLSRSKAGNPTAER